MKLVILGYPLSHSLSPAMHTAALAQVGLDWRYDAMPVPPAELPAAIQRLRGEEFAGGNVTVPHKEAVLSLLDGLTVVAEAIGAVNTLYKKDGRLLGHNTDAAGFLADLYAVGARIADRPVLVLGAGGSARAVVAACAGVGAEVRVVARRREQAEALQALVPEKSSGVTATLEIFDWTPLGLLQACDECAAIINTTPLGMSPNVDASPWIEGTPFPPDAFVYDLVYNPPQTLFTKQALADGQPAATGLGMLVEQGALAFELWTERPAPRELMRSTAEAKLHNA